MKRLFFIALLALILGAWLFQKIAAGSGYVLISLGNTAYEMSFWTAVGVLVGSLFTLLIIFWLVSAIIKSFASGTQSILNVGRKKNQKRSARGLIDFIEGNWKQARKHLLKSVNHADMPMINYLAAARSTYEMGNHSEAVELLHLAEKSNPDSALAVALTQARMYLVDEKYEQCMANLKRAQEIAPNHPVVLELLQQTYQQLQDWSALREIIPDLRRFKVLEEEEIAQVEINVYCSLLNGSGSGKLLDDVNKQWDATPKSLRKNKLIFTAYIDQLIKAGEVSKSANLVRKQVNQNWDEDLVILYGLIDGADSKRQYLFAKDWQKDRPGSATLLLTLGRLALRNHQWEEAKEYFAGSIKLKQRADNCGELARLLEAMENPEEAAHYYQLALMQTKASLPTLPMPIKTDQQSPSLRVVSD